MVLPMIAWSSISEVEVYNTKRALADVFLFMLPIIIFWVVVVFDAIVAQSATYKLSPLTEGGKVSGLCNSWGIAH